MANSVVLLLVLVVFSSLGGATAPDLSARAVHRCTQELLEEYSLANIGLTLSVQDPSLRRSQIEEVVRFVSAIHRSTGTARLPFHSVTFCQTPFWPYPLGPKKLYWASDSLYVNGPASSQQLLSLWDSGRMLPLRSALRRRWEILNPAGTFRQEIRRLLKAAHQRLLSGLAPLVDTTRPPISREAVAAQLRALLAEEGNLGKLSGETHQRIEQLGSAVGLDPQAVVQQMLAFLQSDQLLDATEDSIANAVLETAENEDVQTVSIATGIVAVTNFHRIGTMLSFHRPRDRRHIEVTTRKIRHINISLGLLVGVATGDAVHVKLSSEALLANLAIERAFDKLSPSSLSSSHGDGGGSR